MTTTPWTNIESVNYDTKRVYLHSDTVANGFDAIAAYFEVQLLIQINANGEQNRRPPYLGAEGKIKKTDKPSYTPRFAYTKTSWRFIPYAAVSHRLSLLCEVVSEESLTDADVFDLSGLSVNVHIGSDYDQVEIIEISSGSGVTNQDKIDITNLVWQRNERTLTSSIDGLDEEALHNALDTYENKESWRHNLSDIATAVAERIMKWIS